MQPYISGHTRIAGVIGENITYTKSPFIHNYWYQRHNIDGVYVCFNTLKSHFNDTVRGLFHAGIIGLNVTVPFKEMAFELCDHCSEAAIISGAVNCLTYKNGKIYGDNTDGIGFYNALKYLDPTLNLKDKDFIILGAGGAASAIISYLSQFPIQIKILNRTFEKAEKLAEKFNTNLAQISAIEHIETGQILVQTTNLKYITPNSLIDIPDDILSQFDIVMDINYGTDMGAFLARAQNLNIKHAHGLEMLLQQAVPAFELFNHHQTTIDSRLRAEVLKT